MKPKLWLVCGAAAVVVAGGCAGTGPGARQEAQEPQGCTLVSPSPVVTAGVMMWPDPPGMSEALNEIQTAGYDTFKDVYAGVEVVPEAGYAIVYRVPASESSTRYDEVIRRVAGTQCIVIRDSRFSQVALTELQNRISDDTNFWRGRGIQINTVGSAHDGSGVIVGTTQVVQARAEIPEHYHSSIPITVEQAAPVAVW
ncbi:MAG TPA: hypothetical protein VFC19_04570 [Candidatus Limnocylindrales bacterium]|nr:hypothetical protein [Candidatus Limnocylindrales bacterium]